MLGHSGRQPTMDHMLHILLDKDAQLGSHGKQAQWIEQSEEEGENMDMHKARVAPDEQPVQEHKNSGKAHKQLAVFGENLKETSKQ